MVVAAVCVAASVPGFAQDPQVASTGQAVQEPAGALELLFDQGKRLADGFKYDEAVPLFDRLIATMTAGSEIENAELLVQAYEQRARARFALGNSAGAEQDFSALLAIDPDFALASDVSPRVVKVLDNVRRLTIGQLAIQVTPPGEIMIDGRPHTVEDMPLIVNLKSGDHVVSAARTNYTPFEQNVTINASELASLSVVLERVSATISVVTLTEDVEVLLDDVSKGRTTKTGAGAPDPLMIEEVPLGEHLLRLRRECFVDFDLAVTVGPEDVQTEPIELMPAVARVNIEVDDRQATVVVDGEARGSAGSEVTVCAGTHVIEVRGARGRFVDRREWKTGDSATLVAELRSAVPFVMAQAGAGSTRDQLLTTLEEVLSTARGLLFYAPVTAELDAAMQEEKIPANWLNPHPDATDPGLPMEVVRDMGRRLAARLGVQGLATATVGADSNSVTLALLAAGSGEPDLLTLSLSDSASQTRVVDQLGAALPSLVRPWLDAAFIDVLGVEGAVVARAGEGSGLAVGDVVTSAAGTPITSVAELRVTLASQSPAATTLALEVQGPGTPGREVATPVQLAVDTLPVRDPALLANRALLDLQGEAGAVATGVQRTAASISLALVHMRLRNWDEALAALKDVQLPDGPGVSAGTIAYLRGLAFEGLGSAADAQASFTQAAASPARLWLEGPLVAPMAKARLQGR